MSDAITFDSYRLVSRERDELKTENIKLRAALDRINVIRNSIVGLQNINWSEHIYPLVAALNDAGIEGMGYPESKEHFGTMIELLQEAAEHLPYSTVEEVGLKDRIHRLVGKREAPNAE